MEGVVKFFKADRGWAVIVSPAMPGHVWVHFSHVQGDGCRSLEAGDMVDFDAEPAAQGPFHFRATRALLIRHGPAPLLRRSGDRVVIAPPETPDTPLTPPRARAAAPDPERHQSI